MRSNLKYLILLLFGGLLSYSQNTRGISESITKLKQKNLHDSARIDIYLSLAAEYVSYYNDSSFYYLDLAEDLLKKFPSPVDDADAKYLRSIVYYTISEFDKAQWSLNQAIIVAKELRYKKLLAKAYNLLGAIHFNFGNYEESLKQYNSKLEIARMMHDTVSIIETYYNISLINNAEGNYFKSLENNYAALNLSEKTKDSMSMMVVYEGLGISYSKINDIKKAVINLKKALRLAINYGKIYEEAGIWVDLGNVYQASGEQEKALYYYKRGEEAATKNGDKLVASIAMSGKGVSLMKLKKFREAITVFDLANEIHDNISYKKGTAENQLHIADCNIELGRHKDAKAFALRSLAYSTSIGEKKLEGDAYLTLSKIYEKLNNPDSAYLCYKKHVQVNDTINDRNTLRKIADFEDEREREKLEEERKIGEKLAEAELIKQKQIRNIVLIASVIVLALMLFYYRNFKQKQKANVQIKEKKKIIEHKNKDILDSINYSRRLQEAVLPDRKEIKKLLPGSFIIYQPKEIVSGNFYFLEQDEKGNIHVALADSTKQGVPGAFMSISGYNIIKQALKIKGQDSPSSLLKFLDKGLNEFLRNEEKSAHKEGIQMAYCIITRDKKELSYAGAGLSLWISREGKLEGELLIENGSRTLYELKSGHDPIGRDRLEKDFKEYNIQLKAGDTVYLLTNGNEAQLNSKGQEYGKKRLAALLNSPEITEEKIINEFNNWRASVPQTDDVCLIVIKA
jgi:serine phosphatase RsbU (regulator of sigma subunit)